MRLYIIRHGDPDYEKDCLTLLGKEQAGTIPKLPWTETVTKIICSPLGRAVETAKPLADARHISIEVKPWLREMDDITVYSRRRPDLAVWNVQPEMLSGWADAGWTDEEQCGAIRFQQRWEELRRGADDFLMQYGIRKDEFGWRIEENRDYDINVPIFCHLGVGMTLMAYLLDISPCTIWRSVFLAPSSVTCLLLEMQENKKANFRILQMGDTSHLVSQGVDVTTGGLQYNIF